MGLASCLVRWITVSGCGMQRRGSHWVSPCRGTLVRFCQSRSRRMELASCLVLGKPLSAYAIHRRSSHSLTPCRAPLLCFSHSHSPPTRPPSPLFHRLPLT